MGESLRKVGATLQLITFLLQAAGFIDDARVDTHARDLTFSLAMNNRGSLS